VVLDDTAAVVYLSSPSVDWLGRDKKNKLKIEEAPAFQIR